MNSDLLNRMAIVPPDQKVPRMPLPLPQPPAAILFDFDGVIVDSARLKTEAYAKIYAGEDAAKVSKAMRHQQMHGGITRRATPVSYTHLTLPTNREV